MNFVPEPENDFREFIDTYYNECRRRVPNIEAIAGKWRFEDLIPGLSDFDTRFICSDAMTTDDWCKMSSAVGQIHLDLCREYPKWARILEHLPGVNLTWNELTDEVSYYPEYHQWSFYNCSNPHRLKSSLEILERRPWDGRDEYFHLKKFLVFYGPYNRSIDPAVNLGTYENKYPLHSRMMHYFTPPVHSAVSIIRKKHIVGKREALRTAQELFPEIRVFDEIMRTVGTHYEVPELYVEPGLSALEERLYDALKVIKDRMLKHVTLVPENAKGDIGELKKAVSGIKIPPQLVLFDNSRFSRLMKGRLNFYSSAPLHFDNKWVIQNELGRIGNMFYRVPYRVYWQVMHNETVENPDDIIPKLVPDVLTPDEAKATLEFSRLTPGTWDEGREVEISKAIAGVFDDFFKGLSKIMRQVKDLYTADKS